MQRIDSKAFLTTGLPDSLSRSSHISANITKSTFFMKSVPLNLHLKTSFSACTVFTMLPSVGETAVFVYVGCVISLISSQPCVTIVSVPGVSFVQFNTAASAPFFIHVIT